MVEISLYKLARNILPLSVQARLGNRHKVKRKTLDPLLFNFTNHPHEQLLHYEKAATRNVPLEALEQNPFISPEIAASYRKWYDVLQTEQVIKVTGEVFIEPVTGWPMGRWNQLYLSLHPSGISPYMPVPPYRSILRKSPVQKLEKVISLRDVNETGYSHFYTDLMAKLALVSHTGCDLKDYTLVISKKVAETAYGIFLLVHSPLFKAVGEIHLQGDEFITCKEAIFANVCINPTSNKVFLEVAKNAKAACPPKSESGERKVFLTRGIGRRRRMRNDGVIGEILTARGFEMVDADKLSLPEQIELFSNCRHLVGIHGAGLANILFRAPQKMSLFEVREPLRPILGVNPLYHNMAVAMGFDYGTTIGVEPHIQDQSFIMPPERFEADFSKFWAAVS